MLEFLAPIALAANATPDGTRLKEGDACYAFSAGDQPLGFTWQSVRAAEDGDIPVWEITVRQIMTYKSFDMRDVFILRRSDLRPIRMTSFRSGEEQVRVLYGAEQVETIRPGTASMVEPLPGPVWDGNLWGLTFAALPLADSAHFELPYFHYDKGFGHFTLDVVGSEDVAGRAAWVVEADPGSGRKARYLIAKDAAEELGYSGGAIVQSPGGDCSALAGE
ncbi:DUF3108 domain-containing protein [Altererythrobacter sp. Z27]|uniref:DUF3108 domain-containing protein n=1 Tax=Altererythrobacter sp. Z27 TaxID=3461147 RepID=UPI0040440315